MARGIVKSKREPLYTYRDRITEDKVLNYFIARLMKDGRKERAQAILAKALRLLKAKLYIQARDKFKNPLWVVYKAVKQVRPLVTTKAHRLGGSTVIVPVPLTERKSITLGIKWIVDAAKNARVLRRKSNLFTVPAKNRLQVDKRRTQTSVATGLRIVTGNHPRLRSKNLTPYKATRRPSAIASSLAVEILFAARGKGQAVQRKHALYRLAKANQTFATYRRVR